MEMVHGDGIGGGVLGIYEEGMGVKKNSSDNQRKTEQQITKLSTHISPHFHQLQLTHQLITMPSRYESAESLSPEPLGQPLQFQPSGRIAKNRFLKSPMAEALASWSPTVPSERGVPTDGLVELYKW